jgi:hypothetical protein
MFHDLNDYGILKNVSPYSYTAKSVESVTTIKNLGLGKDNSGNYAIGLQLNSVA